MAALRIGDPFDPRHDRVPGEGCASPGCDHSLRWGSRGGTGGVESARLLLPTHGNHGYHPGNAGCHRGGIRAGRAFVPSVQCR
jgi:hypothetical protein